MFHLLRNSKGLLFVIIKPDLWAKFWNSGKGLSKLYMTGDKHCFMVDSISCASISILVEGIFHCSLMLTVCYTSESIMFVLIKLLLCKYDYSLFT